MSDDANLTSVELFTGAGGLAIAGHLSGFSHRALFEWNKDACETLRANSARNAIPGISSWSEAIFEGDVREVSFSDFRDVDLVAGGPPCQPFSLGGVHAGREDHRDMIPQFIRAVRETTPRAFVMENVRGLARRAFATYLEYSKLQLSYPDAVRRPKEGWQRHLKRLQQHHTSTKSDHVLTYNVLFSEVLNAADFGVPQCRDRIFIIGFRSDVNAGWSQPESSFSRARLDYEQRDSFEYWRRVGITPDRVKVAGRQGSDAPPRGKAWRTIREAIADLPPPFADADADAQVFNHRYQPGARPYPGHTGSPIDRPSKALKAGGHGVPGGENMIALPDGTYRYLTVREAARVQTFPDSWHFKGAWSEAMRQLGNAVPVELARTITDSVARSLR